MPLYGVNHNSNIFENKQIYSFFWKLKYARIVHVRIFKVRIFLTEKNILQKAACLIAVGNLSLFKLIRIETLLTEFFEYEQLQAFSTYECEIYFK